MKNGEHVRGTIYSSSIFFLWGWRPGFGHLAPFGVALEMIQLIAGYKAFHSTISKMKFGVQDMISSNAFNQFLISNTPWTRKWVEKMKNLRDSQIVVSKPFDLLENARTSFRVEEHFDFIEEIWCNRQMRRFIFNQRLRLNIDSKIGIFKSRPFDLRWSVKILPCRSWRRGVAWFRLFDLHQTIALNARVHRTHLI